MSYAEKFAQFLNQCHSTYHAISAMEEQLKEAGFIQLKENSTWRLENNRFYYVVRNQSSIIAFKIPEIANVRSLNIVASHSDSPCLKIKPNEDLASDRYNRLNVEVYGGPLLATWLDKPLSIAGRVTIKQNGRLVSKLVDFDEDCAIIPNVAIHQNREANSGYKWNPVTDLVPMYGLAPKEKSFKKVLAEKLEVALEDIYSHDLFLYNRQPAMVWGSQKELISAGRIDNLESAYTSLQAFINSYSKGAINLFAVFDNEEVGSTTKQGMASSFLKDVIERMFQAFYYVNSDIKAILANSFLVSADNAHAVHPNHPELYDGNNGCSLNKGVVIKASASQSYVSDAISSAITRWLCEKAEVPYQYFANRSDSRGGSTQAAISTINLPINAVDVGLAQLAMHSSYETAGSYDVDYMIRFLSEFYNSTIVMNDNTIQIEK